MINPLISIIVPVYNVEEYISKCITSLLVQTFKEIEVILVDDGSTDNSGKICNEFALLDSRIRVLHKSNEGLSSARNKGIAIAKGEYIGFVDSDDWVSEDMFEFLYKNAYTNNADISICGHYIVDGENIEAIRNNGEISILNHDEALNLVLLDKEINSFAWDKLYKRELFSNLQYKIGRKYEDIAFTYLIFDRIKKIVIINESKYFYLRRQGSICLQLNPLNKLHLFYGFHERYLFALNKPEVQEILKIMLKKSVGHGFNAINSLLLVSNYEDKISLIEEFYKHFKIYNNVKIKDIGFLYFVKTNLIIKIPKIYLFLYPYFNKFKNILNESNRFFQFLKSPSNTIL